MWSHSYVEFKNQKLAKVKNTHRERERERERERGEIDQETDSVNYREQTDGCTREEVVGGGGNKR